MPINSEACSRRTPGHKSAKPGFRFRFLRNQDQSITRCHQISNNRTEKDSEISLISSLSRNQSAQRLTKKNMFVGRLRGVVGPVSTRYYSTDDTRTPRKQL